MKIFNFLSILFLSLITGCANYAPANMQAQSKVLSPEKDHSLVYVIRPKSNGGKLLKLPLPFKYNGQKIGTLWAGQYLFFNAKPMKMVLNGENNQAITINIVANKTYFLEYKSTGGIGASFSGNKPLPTFRVMNGKEGRDLINNYRLSGKFERVTLTQSNAKTTHLVTQKIAPIQSRTQTNKNYTKTSFTKPTENSMKYDNENKEGYVTVVSGKKKRKKAITMIEALCSTKNIALKVGSGSHGKGATYTTMDESLKNGQLTIHFSCAY